MGFECSVFRMAYKDREKQRAYQREWVANNRKTWFEDKECVRCGSRDDLRLDHIDPSTKISHSIWSWSWVRIAEEVSKCQVLCDSCHKRKTKENGENTFYGEDNQTAKLTWAKVATIREKLSQGEKKRVLAREYKVDPRLIRFIELNKIWRI